MQRERTDDEAVLLERARSGDTEAFEALYRRANPRIFALCRRMVGDDALADELCQRTFVRAWRQLHGFRGDSRWTSWLHRIAVNQVLMHRRGAGRREARVLPMHAPPEGRSGGAEPALMDLEAAIARLPERARRVFVLHDVEGYKHAEVADLLGVTVGTSKAQLHRARTLLRQELTR